MNIHNERMHGLDHLRSVAILLVMLFHYKVYYTVPSWIDTISNFGWSGVDLFFVLSGYLISEKIFYEHDRTGLIRFKQFYWNRSFRILPAYLAVVALYLCFPSLQEGRGLQPLWKFITFTQNISIDLFNNTFSHAWSLCVEEHFYLLLPILLYTLFLKKLTNKAHYIITTILLFGIMVRYLAWKISVEPTLGSQKLFFALKYIYYPTYTRLDGLLTGVAIAALFRYRPLLKNKIIKHGDLLMLFSVFMLLAIYFLFNGSVLSIKFTTMGTSVFGFPLISFAYGLMVIAALSPGSILYKLKFKPSRMLATLSYSIYLTHKITNHLINTKFNHMVKMENDQLFAISLFASVLGGIILHLMMERPFLILRDKYKNSKFLT